MHSWIWFSSGITAHVMQVSYNLLALRFFLVKTASAQVAMQGEKQDPYVQDRGLVL